MLNISLSSPTAPLANLQDSNTTAPPEPDRVSSPKRYLISPYNLWSSHTTVITGSGLELDRILIRLVAVRLTAKRCGGCVLWVAGNGSSPLSNCHAGSFTTRTCRIPVVTHTLTHIKTFNKWCIIWHEWMLFVIYSKNNKKWLYPDDTVSHTILLIHSKLV